MAFQTRSVRELSMNPFVKIDKQWMLLTAGTSDRGFNTMTASWGMVGTLWSKPVSEVFVRPQRYTKTFVDREKYYTLSFFPEEYRKQLAYLGSHSGRDEDKIAKTGLTPTGDDRGVWFEEAELVLVCRKLYRGTLTEDQFVDPAVAEKNYPEKDFHDFYIGEVVSVLEKTAE